MYSFFFFSSRRRHTRLQGDWSSDVCSSDLRKRPQEHGSGLGLPIVQRIAECAGGCLLLQPRSLWRPEEGQASGLVARRSEEHTSELQSPCNLVCRLLLEKKKNAGSEALMPYLQCIRLASL